MKALAAHRSLREPLDVATCGGKATNLARLYIRRRPGARGHRDPERTPRQPRDRSGGDAARSCLRPLIIRSSAIGEDSADASFAGQLDSVANITTVEALRAAIIQVRASRQSDRVLAYQASRGVTLAGMGIIVQRQVPRGAVGRPVHGVAGRAATDAARVLRRPRRSARQWCGESRAGVDRPAGAANGWRRACVARRTRRTCALFF